MNIKQVEISFTLLGVQMSKLTIWEDYLNFFRKLKYIYYLAQKFHVYYWHKRIKNIYLVKYLYKTISSN